MLRLAALCAALCAAAAAAAAAAPAAKTDLASAVGARLRLCGRARADFDACMRRRLQALLPELAESGIPELGVARAEPFVLPEMALHYERGNMSADLRIRDSRTWGVQGLQITSVKSLVNDPEQFRFEVGYHIPRMYTEGNYKVDARLVVPLVTKGYYNITMADVAGVWNVSGEHYARRGQDFVRVTSFSTRPSVGDMRVFASDLVPGNPELGEYLLALANQHWRPIYAQLLPEADAAWGLALRERMNRAFARLPFDALFPLA